MSISTIIPLFNKEDTVQRAVRSVLEQGVDVEVVVVDDGSTDGSEQALRPFRDDIVYIRQQNEGPAAARNRGVEVSSGDYLTFLDADDEYLPGCLRAHLRCREFNRNVNVSFNSYRIESGKARYEEHLEDRIDDCQWIAGLAFVHGFSISLVRDANPGNLCIDKPLFMHVGGFDPRLRCWEVTDLFLRALLRASVVGIIPETLTIRHLDASNSQFGRTGNNAVYASQFARNLLDSLAAVPEGQRAWILRQIRSMLGLLRGVGDYRAFKELAKRACPILIAAGEGKRVCALSRLPPPVLSLLDSFRRGLMKLKLQEVEVDPES